MLLQDHGSGQCGLQAVGGPEPDYPPERVQGLLVFFLVVRERIEELLHLIGSAMLADDLPLFGGEGLRLRRHFCALSTRQCWSIRVGLEDAWHSHYRRH